MEQLTFPEDNVSIPDAGDDLLDNMLTEKTLGVGDGSNLQRVECHKRLGRILFLVAVFVFIEDSQARYGLHELVALAAAVVSDGRLGGADRVRPGVSEQGSVLVDLFGLTTMLLILSRVAIRAMPWIGNLVETVVDDFALRKVGEEAPSNNLGCIGPCLVDALVLSGCTIVPLECPGTVVVSI